jgi:phosphomannomutase
MNAEVAHALGIAFAEFVGAPMVIVARDMRATGEELVNAFSEGV